MYNRAARTYRRGHRPPIAEGFAQNLLVVAFSLQPVEQGWLVETSPGLPVSLRRGDRTLYPLHLISDLAEGEVSDDEWKDLLTKNEITA